jgi:membrane protease YdiL (CAAX protease family)
MIGQARSTEFINNEVSRHCWFHRTGLFILLLACEAAIIVFGSHYFNVFRTNKNLTYNLIVSAAFLTVSLWFRYDQQMKAYWPLAFALFMASTAIPISALLTPWNRVVLSWLSVSTNSSQGLAIDKVWEVLVKTIPILVLVRLSGADLGSVFLQRGQLKSGLGIGALVFFFLGTASFMFAAERFTSLDRLMAAVGWGLVFSIGNSFMEELWLRGIFLKRFAPFIGNKGAVWCTSLIFAWMHSFVFYFMPSALPFFFINTLMLGLACGYLMIKSDSIWGPVMIHAGSDFFLFVALLANA